MDKHEIKNAATDRGISALKFLPYYFKVVLEPTNDFLRGFYDEAFVLKADQCMLQEFRDLQVAIGELDIKQWDKNHLTHIASIGYYFNHRQSLDDHLIMAGAVVWLIENEPKNSCLEMPYCSDFDSDAYDIVSLAWDKAVQENFNDTAVLNNAAQFFFMKDPLRSRELLEKCIALDPNSNLWRDSLKELESQHSDL